MRRREPRAQKLFPEVFLQKRKEAVLPILQNFKEWLDSKACTPFPLRIWAKR
jgi:hypothetical protein